MKNLRAFLASPIALPLLVAISTVLFGADVLAAGGAEHGHEPHVANWFGLGRQHQEAPALGWMMVTFAVFVAILVGWVRKPLGNYLEARSGEVRRALMEAQQAKAEAEARAAESEERLRKLDAEVAALTAEFRAQGEAELVRLEAAARATAERIAKDAEDTLAAESERAREALKAEAAKLALELAEARIRGAIADGDHQRLTQSFIQDLSA